MIRIDRVIRAEYTDEQAIKDLNECDKVIKEIEKITDDIEKKNYMMAHAYLHKRYIYRSNIYRSKENEEKVKEMYDIVRKINPNEEELLPRELEKPSK